ncbi:hypothetical protein LPJ66_004525 [Kickxella alabastrina]|uniref:Uncharacterized protein n=1 Tax=Kickxella alabastrina TaxID=61397 RepID=A0ACC1IKW0_9FUNG|nr:hypothetical protein LPJ66_004525 [Kickxella alabastrina]
MTNTSSSSFSDWEFVYMRNMDIGRISTHTLHSIWATLGIDQSKVACANSVGAFLAEFLVHRDYIDDFVHLLSRITTQKPLDASLSISRDTEYVPINPYAHLLGELEGVPRDALDALRKYARESLTRRWSAVYYAVETSNGVREFVAAEMHRHSLSVLPPPTPQQQQNQNQNQDQRNQQNQRKHLLKSPPICPAAQCAPPSVGEHRGSGLVHSRPPNHALLSHDHLAELIPQPTMHRLIIYADGAYLPDRGTAGIGAFFQNTATRPLSQRLPGHQSCARAEILAMRVALDRMAAELPGRVAGDAGCEIWVCSDSRYAVDGINVYMETWEASGWVTAKGRPIANRSAFLDLREATRRLAKSGYTVFIHHLPAHAGIRGNDIADMLAKAGALL